MASRVAGDVWDWASRALVPHKTVETEQPAIKYDDNGKPIVYKRRWFILAAYCMAYFTWNLHTYRQTPITAEYALYFDKTNEFQPPPEYGIDFMVITDNIYLLTLYPVAGILMDKYGIKMMILGSIGQAISTWWWYLSFHNFGSVMLSRLLASSSGVLVATALLRISSQWFPQGQRAIAVAIGTVASTLGAGAALVVGPMFTTGPKIINFALKSCKKDFQDGFNASGLETNECTEDAVDSFCCAAPIDIDFLNLVMALLATLVMVFTVIVTKDAPATPPSLSGHVKRGPSFVKAMKLMFSKGNYSQICLADFLASGPPLVLYSTISRIFPPSVADYATLAAAAGIVIAIPGSAIFAYYLGKTRRYYEMTAAGYVLGFVSWFLATICLAAGTLGADITLIILGILAVLFFSLWTVSVYELKMEYVFNSQFALQGFVVAIDRTIINTSSLVFVSSIPPERFDGARVSGRLFTFLVGSVFMLMGVILVLTIKNKRRYLRLEYEEKEHVAFNALSDDLEVEDDKKSDSPAENEPGDDAKNSATDVKAETTEENEETTTPTKADAAKTGSRVDPSVSL